jgi:hypothetical protein
LLRPNAGQRTRPFPVHEAGCPAIGWTSFGVAVTEFGYSLSMKKDSPDTAESDAGAAGADDDVQSDPGKGTEDRTEWTDEGGATPSGPADTGDQTQ